MIRKAKVEDLPELFSIAERFTEESSLKLTFDREVANTTFFKYINGENTIFLIYEYDNLITGGIMGVVQRDFHKESSAYITKLYIEKEFRGLSISRYLLEEFEVEASKLGASMIFSSATAGMGERVEKLYSNLFKRYGYQVLGRVLVKEMKSG